MNTIPIFQVVAASAVVTSVLGADPTRFFLFGQARRLYNDGVPIVKPYAVWQVISGSPENHLDCPPQVDHVSIQVDAYGETAAQVRAVIVALRDALEPHAYIMSWTGEDFEDNTKLYRSGFTIDWFVSR